MKFVPAVARLFCLALPGSFLDMFAQNKVDLVDIIAPRARALSGYYGWLSATKCERI